MRQVKGAMCLLSLSVVLLACETSKGTDGTLGGGGTGGACASVGGTWTVQETLDQSQCGGKVKERTASWTITQTQCQATVDASGLVWSGAVGPTTLTLSGTSDEDEGTITVSNQVLTVGPQSLSGTVAWTYADSDGSCAGTTTVSGVLTAPAPGQGGDADGSSGGSDPGGGGSTAGAALTDREEELVGLWYRYHAYDGSSNYYRFNDDRTACKWEEAEGSNKRKKVGRYVSWRLDEANPVGQARYTVIVTYESGTSADIGIYDYAKDTFLQGGYANLSFSKSSDAKICE
ncbi:MAG: hypothetical protein AMXMBFR64_41640 [Myxococcales bacterium]